jgi:hypothetical protein
MGRILWVTDSQSAAEVFQEALTYIVCSLNKLYVIKILYFLIIVFVFVINKVGIHLFTYAV